MKIKFDFDKCIYCLENPADSWEHIIPESIGGRLQVRALCSHCNNSLGSELISKVRKDPSIRLAVKNLKSKIPELFRSIENGQPYFAPGKDNTVVRLIRKNGRYVIVPEQKEDGLIILDTKQVSKNIAQKLKKGGLTEDEIADKIQSFQELEPDKMIQLSNNLKVVKRETGPIEQCFTNLKDKRVNLLGERVVVLMAYEFLSLLIGNSIYEDRLDFIRNFIREGKQSAKLVIKSFMTRDYSPDHRIYPELLKREIIINIILFGWLWYKVLLKSFALSSPDFVYVEDLKNKKTLIAETVAEAKQDIYFKL